MSWSTPPDDARPPEADPPEAENAEAENAAAEPPAAGGLMAPHPAQPRASSANRRRSTSWELLIVIGMNFGFALAGPLLAILLTNLDSLTWDMLYAPVLRSVFIAIVIASLVLPLVGVGNTLLIAAFDRGPVWRRWMLAVPLGFAATGLFAGTMSILEAPGELMAVAPLVALLPFLPFWGLAWFVPYRLARPDDLHRTGLGTAELMLLTGMIAILVAWMRAWGGLDAGGAMEVYLLNLLLLVVLPACGFAGVLIALALALLGPPSKRWVGRWGWPPAAAVVSAYGVAALATEGFSNPIRLYDERYEWAGAWAGAFLAFLGCALPTWLRMRAAGFRFLRWEDS